MTKQIFSLLAFFLISSMASSHVFASEDTYHIDKKHSFANFSIRHVVSKTSGTFTDITGEIKINPDNLATASVNAEIDMQSLSTSHEKRDKNIKKPKYLDLGKYSKITFVSKTITPTSKTEGVMIGDFTMHGVTKELKIPFKVLGFGFDPWGGQRSGFEAKTIIKASDYGFTWMKKPNAPVGDDIEVTLLIEGIKAKKDIEVLKK